MSLSKLTPTYHKDTYPSISPTKPTLSQTGKTILITGGGGGIGFEIARSFAKASASRIIIIGRRAGFLDEALIKLREDFPVADIASETSIASLWELLHSQNILVHVLVLNAAHISPIASETLSLTKNELMAAFDTNVGGNFLMSANFIKQVLRPAGLQLHLVSVSTAGIHMHPCPAATVRYNTSKVALMALLGHIATERPVEDVQIISFHPGTQYSEFASKNYDRNAVNWDKMALPADFSVWAASPEASWLHGRFLWAHWDVDELRADGEVLQQFNDESGFLKVGVQGLKSVNFQALAKGN
ncbi:short-chain dehydrogenase/reductase [Gymnopus androsaceus JB14]|uniref:Short-chain dehydrogenase/reductase n=1 Tax=Gymnopus androsaceus JB14 TaxID=1447944 RepID=A0A6A4HF90_9AGAR|nr:short-chain dehydrogenase/reductase [Gymnopus androsaceus JB14]